MKTTAFLPVGAIMLWTALLAAAGPAAAVDKAGDVVSVRGKATIERRATKAEAQPKSVLLESDSVMTRERARVKMLFRDDSILTLGANSRLVIRKYLYSPESKRRESIYELADGKLRSVVGGPGFKVTTPTAFAAARGTILDVTYKAETQTTEIAVLEGSAEVRNANADIKGVQIVKTGQATTVRSGMAPTTPRTFDRRKIDSDFAEGSEGSPYEIIEIVRSSMPQREGRMTAHEIHERSKPQTALYPPIQQVPGGNVTNVRLNLTFP